MKQAKHNHLKTDEKCAKKQLFTHDYPFDNSYSTLITVQQYNLTKSKKNINGSNLGCVTPYPFQIKQFVFPKKNL